MGLVSQLLPAQGDGGIRRALDLFLSLCLICAVLSPMSSILAQVREGIENGALDIESPEIDGDIDSAIFDSLANEARGEIELRLRGYICEELKLPEDCVEVGAEVSAGADGVMISRITVYLYGRGMWSDPRKILAAVGKYTDAECVIVNGR